MLMCLIISEAQLEHQKLIFLPMSKESVAQAKKCFGFGQFSTAFNPLVWPLTQRIC